MLRKIRTLLAIVFFVGITLLFLDFTGTLHHWLGWMAKTQLLPAILALNVVVIVVLVALTLIFGRLYCSVICPMGVMQDVIARFNRKRNKYSYSPAISWLRYLMLAIMVVALVAGIGSLAALLAPYSSYGRIANNFFQPVWLLGNNILASIDESLGGYNFYSKEVWIHSLPTFIVAVVTFVIVAILAFRNGRTYCNTICPVGTVLGFLSRFAWFKVRFNTDKCRSCSACSRHCKAACIDFKTHSVDYSRCVACGDCLTECRFDALSYCHTRPTSTGTKAAKTEATATEPAQPKGQPDNVTSKPNTDEKTDTSRRSFLLATALVATSALAQEKKKVDGGLAPIVKKVAPHRTTPLTPPGSLSAEHMAQHCTGCQLCVSECPNGVLRPSTDLMKLMQPTMSFERGACRPECTRCSEVCPAGAIKPITRAEKSSIQIGHAVWIKKNCVPVHEGVECGNCARHCPAGAIDMVPLDPNDENSVMIPSVNEARCIGCGTCENLCPSRPLSAIYVEGHEVHRHI
jgi:ferredoxin